MDKTKVLADSVSDEAHFLKMDGAISLCPRIVKGVRMAQASFIRTLVLFMKVSPS